MESKKKDFVYRKEKDATGSSHEGQDFKIVKYPFGKYEIKLKLTSDNKFLDILEIKINKDFLSFKQKISRKGFHDVDEFYPE